MIPERKALYIDGHGATRVLRDGPALRLRVAQHADLLVPLRRVCRVVVMGSVTWSSQALRGCLDASIPVSFLDQDGRLRGNLVSPASTTSASGIVRILDTYCTAFRAAVADHRLWVETFCYDTRLRYARELGRSVYVANAALLTYLTDHVGKHYARSSHLKQFDQRLLGLLKAHLLYLFSREASPLPWLPSLQRLKIDLVKDYASILLWTLQLSKRRFLKRAYMRARRHGHTKAEIALDAAPAFYESQSSMVEARFRRLLRQHHVYLWEALGCRAYYEKTPIPDLL